MTGAGMGLLYDLIFGALRRREPEDVFPRCAYSVLIFFEGDHNAGSRFSSFSLSSLPRRLEGVWRPLDVLAAARFDGERSNRVGG